MILKEYLDFLTQLEACRPFLQGRNHAASHSRVGKVRTFPWIFSQFPVGSLI